MADKKNEAKIKFSAETAEMNNDIKKAESALKELRSELRLNAEQMKTNGENVESLGRQHEILQKESEQYERKLNALNGQLESAVKIWGENSTEAEKLRIKINNTGAAFEKVKQQLNGTEDSLKKCESGMGELEEAVEDVGDGFTVANGAMATFAGNMLTNLVGAVKDGASAIYHLADETREYRAEMNKLSSAAEDNGYSTELAKEKYMELYEVLADETTANTTVSNFMAMQLSQEDLNRVLEAATGIWAKYGDSIPLDGLAESVNETSKVGKVTGNLADALNWAGISEDEFNEKLQECSGEQERQELIVGTLEQTYGDLAKSYKNSNKQVMEANRATAEYNDTMADLGETMEPVTTEIKKGMNEVLEAVMELIDADTEEAVEKIGDGFEWVAENIETIVEVAGIGATALGAMFVTNKAIGFISSIKNMVTTFKALSAATTTATAAQTGLNAAMSANLIGVLVGAGTALVGVLSAISKEAEKEREQLEAEIKKTYGLTDAQKALVESVEDRKKAYQELEASREIAVSGIEQEYGYYQTLADELRGIVDVNGKIIEGNEERAAVIAGALSDALGMEIEITDNVIQNYNELNESIEKVIQTKKTEAILNQYEDAYTEAISGQRDAFNELITTKEELAKKTEELTKVEQEYQKAYETLMDSRDTYNPWLIRDSYRELELAGLAVEAVKESQQELTESVKSAEETWISYNRTIKNYEGVQAAMISGDVDEIEIAMLRLTNSFITAENGTKESLERQVEDMRNLYQGLKREIANGAPGVDQEMVDNAKKMVDDANAELMKFNTLAKDTLMQVGQSANAGFASTKPLLIGTVIDIATGMNAELGKPDYAGTGMNGMERFIGGVYSQKDKVVAATKDVAEEGVASADSVSAYSAGYDFSAGFARGITSYAVGSAAASMAQTALNTVRKTLDMHSPSRKSYDAGTDFTEGFADSIIDNSAMIKKASEAMAQEAMFPIDKLEGHVEVAVSNSTSIANMQSLTDAINSLANRPVAIEINGREFALATASDSDNVNGSRSVLRSRGLALE